MGENIKNESPEKENIPDLEITEDKNNGSITIEGTEKQIADAITHLQLFFSSPEDFKQDYHFTLEDQMGQVNAFKKNKRKEMEMTFLPFRLYLRKSSGNLSIELRYHPSKADKFYGDSDQEWESLLADIRKVIEAIQA